ELAVTDDLEEVQKLPQLLEELVALQLRADGPELGSPRCRRTCSAAICSVVCSLAPHASPGQVPALDTAVKCLLDRLRGPPESLGGDEPEVSWAELMEIVIEPLGKVALAKEGWRTALLHLGAKEVISARIPEQHGNHRLEKYCVWFLAALAGLPFVVQELQRNFERESVVDAALCSIIDILDDDLEGEWVLRSTSSSCSEADVHSLLMLVAQAMHKYAENAMIQSRSCHCLALLLRLTRLCALSEPCLLAMLSGLLKVFKAHSHHTAAVRDCCFALRTLLEPRNSSPEPSEDDKVQHLIAETLRREDVGLVLEQAIKEFAAYEDSYRMAELFEGLAALHVTLAGAGKTLSVLGQISELAGCTAVRAAGLKALFELGRSQHAVLTGATGVSLGDASADGLAAVRAAVQSFAQEDSDDLLRSAAELLHGLCQGIERMAAMGSDIYAPRRGILGTSFLSDSSQESSLSDIWSESRSKAEARCHGFGEEMHAADGGGGNGTSGDCSLTQFLPLRADNRPQLLLSRSQGVETPRLGNSPCSDTSRPGEAVAGAGAPPPRSFLTAEMMAAEAHDADAGSGPQSPRRQSPAAQLVKDSPKSPGPRSPKVKDLMSNCSSPVLVAVSPPPASPERVSLDYAAVGAASTGDESSDPATEAFFIGTPPVHSPRGGLARNRGVSISLMSILLPARPLVASSQ
ncbi:unnamed protein product, partial [Polarella glacialis]